MISVEDARRIINAALAPVDAETVTAARAFGRTLSESVVALRAQPPATVSAMDGFALRADDLNGVPLMIVGESRAGGRFEGKLASGETVRISTGATLPEGADQVVIRENATVEGDRVSLADTPRPGKNVRLEGLDFGAGDTLLQAGTVLTPAKVALAGAAGYGTLPVMRRPRVAILSSGDELVEPGVEAGPDEIFNSNAPGLSALIFSVGGVPLSLGIARDEPDDIRELLESAEGADLLVTVGGASVGDHDHLREVFAADGGTLSFEKVKVKPGKPAWFGKLGALPVLGLPGNPVSAMVTARLFLVPAIRTLLGQPHALALAFGRAVLLEPLAAEGERETFLRGVTTMDPVRGPCVRALPTQDSSVLASFAAADVLIRRPAHASAAQAGDVVDILPL